MREKVKRIIRSEVFYTTILVGFIFILQLHQDSLVRQVEDKEFKVMVNATQMSSANASYAGFYSEMNFVSQAVQKCKESAEKDCEIIWATYDRKVAEFFGIENSRWASYGALEDSLEEYNLIFSRNKLKIFRTKIVIQCLIFIIIAYGLYAILKKQKA